MLYNGNNRGEEEGDQQRPAASSRPDLLGEEGWRCWYRLDRHSGRLLCIEIEIDTYIEGHEFKNLCFRCDLATRYYFTCIL